MANTHITETGKKLLYDELLFKQASNGAFFSKYFGSAVKVKRDMEKGRGSEVKFGLAQRISPSSGVVNGVIEGVEAEVPLYFDSVKLDQHRQAVRDGGLLERTQAFFDIDSEISEQLRTWTTERMDAVHLKALFTSGATTAAEYYIGAAANDAALTSSNKMSAAAIAEIRTIAETGKSRTYEPIKPIKVMGRDMYVLLLHSDCRNDLIQDDDYKNSLDNAFSSAAMKDNPLFVGDVHIWQNMAIFFDRRAPISSSTTTIGKGVVLGQDAILTALGKFNTVEKAFDYEDQRGICSNLLIGCKRATFNSKPLGSMIIGYARTNVSGLNNEAELNYTQVTTSNQ